MDKFEKIQQIKEEIRQKVLPRVKKTALNYKADDGMVRRLVESSLEAHVQTKMEGHIDEAVRRFIVEEIVNEIFGLGPIDRFINDPAVWEIMVNGPKEIYVEREGKLQKADAVFDDEEQVQFYIERILSPVGRRVTEFEPYVDARLPDGSRVNVVRSPVAANGPILTIRKAQRKVLEMQDLIHRRTIDDKVGRFLKVCVKNHLNIILAGGPGSGKTTMLNILASFIPDAERIITIEDTLELRITGKHRVAMETRPANIEGKGIITIRELVRNSLHMRPDRVIIGEVRGEETLDMLQCMNIGRDGSMTTLHANSPLDALLRLETMSMMGTTNVSTDLIRRQIVSAIDLIICMDRLLDGTRRVTSIAEVIKTNTMEYSLRDIFALVRKDEAGVTTFELKGTGYAPVFLKKFKDMESINESFFK